MWAIGTSAKYVDQLVELDVPRGDIEDASERIAFELVVKVARALGKEELDSLESDRTERTHTNLVLCPMWTTKVLSQCRSHECNCLSSFKHLAEWVCQKSI